MVRKIAYLLAVITVMALAGVGLLVFFSQKPDILARARAKYNQAIAQKINLDNGPCLGKIADDWVLDIAHLPRQPIDDLPENQCADYLSGRVHHFVEMTPKGEVIRVQ